MRLTLSYDESDAWFPNSLEFLRRRLYVIETLVPPGYERYFQEHARFVSAHTSTAIEGNQLSDEEAFRVLIEGADESNPGELEKQNLSQAYEVVSILAEPSVHVDEGLIRALNSLVLRGLPDQESRHRGLYRTGTNLVVDTLTREVRYRPPRPEWVPGLMEGFIHSIREWREKEYPGPIIAALAHFGLVSIHPFEDGNGRTARLIADMILQQTGWTAKAMIAVSKAIFDSRSEYYDSLRETQGEDFLEQVDVSAFLRFHMKVMAMAAASLEDRVISFSKRLDEWRTKLEGVVNSRQAMAIAFLLDMGIPLSSSKYAQMTRSSQSSAIADLNDLVKRQVFLRLGTGKLTRYTISPEAMKGID